MKKQIAGVSLVLLMIAATAYAAQKPAKALGVKVPADFVKQEATGFSIKTPPSWKVTKPEGGNVQMQMTADDNTSNVNVVVIAEPLTTRDPDELAAQIAKAVEGQVKNFSLKSGENILVGGEDSPRIVYEGNAQGLDFRWQQTMVTKGGKTYIVTYTALTPSYDKYAPVLDQMLESMEFSK